MKKLVCAIFLLVNVQMAHAGFGFQGIQEGQPYGNCTDGNGSQLGVMSMDDCSKINYRLTTEDALQKKAREKRNTDSPMSTLIQKKKWVTTMATKNGCEGVIRVNLKNKDGINEVFEAICGNKTLEFTCDFSGSVSEARNGIPLVAVAGKSNQTQPACWR